MNRQRLSAVVTILRLVESTTSTGSEKSVIRFDTYIPSAGSSSGMHWMIYSSVSSGSSPLTITYRSAGIFVETSYSRSVAVSCSEEVITTSAPKPSQAVRMRSLSVATYTASNRFTALQCS